jgi:hypothetical protein
MPLSKILNDGISANQTLSLVRVLETANVYATPIGGNVNIDISNNTVYLFNANTTANLTFNFRANSTSTFDSVVQIGQTSSIAIAVKHGTTRHTANVFIDGVLQTPFFVANNKPVSATLTNQEVNIFAYTVFKTGSATYQILAANTLFGLG